MRAPAAVTVSALSVLLVLLVGSCGGVSSVGSSSPARSPTPTPFVTASPPVLVAQGFARLQGHVVDAKTNGPLENVCVVIATGGSCQPSSPRTDSNGFWWIDLPADVEWDFAWTKDGYVAQTKRLTSRPGVQTIDLALAPLS